eukprot:TRINITY_DN22626_c0_g1_i1.p1 TRINITY_DN22626_c0_g1~~TRINITY_DN22626_c0_g1_i1.p1  ORF type:complete len:652 (+),score=113.20 TRINITY_DN22626_c0_g1_i1:69-1958(+)
MSGGRGAGDGGGRGAGGPPRAPSAGRAVGRAAPLGRAAAVSERTPSPAAPRGRGAPPPPPPRNRTPDGPPRSASPGRGRGGPPQPPRQPSPEDKRSGSRGRGLPPGGRGDAGGRGSQWQPPRERSLSGSRADSPHPVPPPPTAAPLPISKEAYPPDRPRREKKSPAAPPPPPVASDVWQSAQVPLPPAGSPAAGLPAGAPALQTLPLRPVSPADSGGSGGGDTPAAKRPRRRPRADSGFAANPAQAPAASQQPQPADDAQMSVRLAEPPPEDGLARLRNLLPFGTWARWVDTEAHTRWLTVKTSERRSDSEVRSEASDSEREPSVGSSVGSRASSLKRRRSIVLHHAQDNLKAPPTAPCPKANEWARPFADQTVGANPASWQLPGVIIRKTAKNDDGDVQIISATEKPEGGRGSRLAEVDPVALEQLTADPRAPFTTTKSTEGLCDSAHLLLVNLEGAPNFFDWLAVVEHGREYFPLDCGLVVVAPDKNCDIRRTIHAGRHVFASLHQQRRLHIAHPSDSSNKSSTVNQIRLKIAALNADIPDLVPFTLLGCKLDPMAELVQTMSKLGRSVVVMDWPETLQRVATHQGAQQREVCEFFARLHSRLATRSVRLYSTRQQADVELPEQGAD